MKKEYRGQSEYRKVKDFSVKRLLCSGRLLPATGAFLSGRKGVSPWCRRIGASKFCTERWSYRQVPSKQWEEGRAAISDLTNLREWEEMWHNFWV